MDGSASAETAARTAAILTRATTRIYPPPDLTAPIAGVMAAEGMTPDPTDVIVTTGGQQALDLVAKTLIDPGDPVICEAPTYPGAVPVFCSYQADTLQVEMDSEGMRIDQLELLLER